MKKIVLIDDDRNLLRYLERYLQKAGHEVLTAQSGLNAVELLASQTADFIFVDYFLPNLNADRLCQIIRRMEHLKEAYLVVMSAAAMELETELSDIQADALIAKGSFQETAKHLETAIGKADTPAADEPDGKIMGLDSIYPRRMTQELLGQYRHLRDVLDSISEGIVEIHQDRVVYANPGAEKMLDRTQEELLAAYLPDLFDAYPRIQIQSLLQTGPKDGSDIAQSQKVSLNEKTLWMRRLHPKGSGGTIILLMSDVTDLIRAETAVAESRQHLDQLVEERTLHFKRAGEKQRQSLQLETVSLMASGLARDLGSLLSDIVACQEQALLGLPKGSPLKREINKSRISTEEMIGIIRDLLTLEKRVITGDNYLDLDEIVTQYLESDDFEKIRSDHEGVKIKFNPESGFHRIVGSSVRLTHMLSKLVANAAEAATRGGSILISTGHRTLNSEKEGYEDIPKGVYVVLSVTDSGIALSKMDRKKIFEPYYTKRIMGRGDTGLGMTLILSTLKDHNGYVDIQSEPGRGTTFELYFPVKK